MKVYGIFQKSDSFIILEGETETLEKDLIAVEYQGFSYAYRKADVGRTLFQEPWEAEEVLEERRQYDALYGSDTR